mmetsp:Transcript_18879/g.32286  ORF Transcript_18879/g.32286 Transcript_18879/m.32286 type:complete len:91 (-) Transcript_18879:288-560(-)
MPQTVDRIVYSGTNQSIDSSKTRQLLQKLHRCVANFLISAGYLMLTLRVYDSLEALPGVWSGQEALEFASGLLSVGTGITVVSLMHPTCK